MEFSLDGGGGGFTRSGGFGEDVHPFIPPRPRVVVFFFFLV